MRRALTYLLLLLPAAVVAQNDDDVFDLKRLQSNQPPPTVKAKPPELDPKRIINQSSSFLKEREPEMTAEEYALYEKMVGMLSANPSLAVRLLENMAHDGKPSPAFAFILGNAYYAAGDVAKTEASYKDAVERYPTFLRAWNNLGVLYYTTGRFGDAVDAFSRSVALGDREPTTYGLLGYSLEKEGNPVAAEVAYMQALSGDPANVDWQEGLLRLSIEGRQLIRAEGIARFLIKSHPTEPRFWLSLANILLLDHRKREALAVLELAAGTGVATPDELILLGDLYADQGLNKEALGIYARLLKPAPETGEQRLLRLAQVLAADNRADDAQRALQALPEKLTPTGRNARLLLQARLAAEAKRWADARRDLEAVLVDNPRSGAALLALGNVHVGEGDEVHAALVFDAATHVPDAAYRANLELANLELRRKHYARSVGYLETALRLERTDEVESYLRRVRTLAADESPSKS